MAEIAFEWGINLIDTLMIVGFITRYLGCKYRDKRRIIGFLIIWAIDFAELCIINHFVSDEGVSILIPVAINLIYALICLEGSIGLKVWVSVLSYVIVLIIAYGTNLFVCNIIGYDPYKMLTVFNSARVISVVVTKILLFHSYRLVLRHRYTSRLDGYEWFMLILVPVLSVFSMSALMIVALDNREFSDYLLFVIGGIVIFNNITYYFFTRLNQAHEAQLQIKLLEQKNENAAKSLEEAESFVAQMKSVRHDMKNQLLIISNYIDSGRYERAKEYIGELTGSYMPDMQEYINSGNDVFDAIVNAKIAVCSRKKIYIEVKEMKGALNGLDAVDTGILFGNLLDNAIEAAEYTKSRRITVDVHPKGCYLSILITNSIEGSVIKDNPKLETAKADKTLHGIGIKTVKELVEKYDGMIQFYEEAGEFCCHVLLDSNRIQPALS